ncbi:hypothetical protein HAX54_029445, partial [Datura stramonium]|nr:hypothetical protein [Datura stramonium]
MVVCVRIGLGRTTALATDGGPAAEVEGPTATVGAVVVVASALVCLVAAFSMCSRSITGEESAEPVLYLFHRSASSSFWVLSMSTIALVAMVVSSLGIE